MTVSTLPPIPLDALRATACLDFIKVILDVDARSLIAEGLRHKWNYVSESDSWTLTVQEPNRSDLLELAQKLDNPPVAEFELSVDFWPRDRGDVARTERLLEQAYVAIGARFRPEDKLRHGAGLKGAVSEWKTLRPFHNRLPKPSEQLIYGHRGEGHQAKLYLKRTDRGRPLSVDQHRLRLETRVTGFHLLEYQLGSVSRFFEGRLRSSLATVFRIVEAPSVRQFGRLSATEIEALEEKMWTRWNKAGVGAFAEPPLPPDASSFARDAAEFRRRVTKSNPLRLALKDYRLLRHKRAHEVIGNALRQLDRRLVG